MHRNWWVRGARDPPRQFSWHRPSWLPLHQRRMNGMGSTLGIPGGHPPWFRCTSHWGMVWSWSAPSLRVGPTLSCFPYTSLDIPGHTPHSSDCYIVSTCFNLQLASQPLGKCQHGQSPAKRRVTSGDLRRGNGQS